MRTGNALLVSALLVLALTGCNQAGSAELSSVDPGTPPVQTVEQAPASAVAVGPTDVSVVMSAATLGDDCTGVGTVPVRAAAPAPKKARAGSQGAASAKMTAARRACQQTSMQLSVSAGPNATATDLGVKSVQLLDEKGKIVAELTASAPAAWSAAGSYAPWNQTIKPGQTLSVTYALTTPVGDALNDRTKTWTMKAVVTVGGKDQTLQRDVTVFVETILPPGVVT